MSYNDREDEIEGSDMEQVIALLEKVEIDYVAELGDMGDDNIVIVNDSVEFIFDDEQNLIDVRPITH